jgi:hypothetical protein
MKRRIAVTVLASALLACGGSSTSPGSRGSSGPSAAQACAELGNAECARLETCSPTDMILRYGDSATCTARVTANCTTSLAAASTGNSPVHTEACSQAYPGWPCTDYLNDLDVPTACQQQTGSVGAGGGCAFPGQCQSGFCAIAPGAACGTCAAQPTLGSSCAGITTCGPGVVCTSDTQTCVVVAASGGACGTGQPCGVGLSCVGSDATTNTQGTCQPDSETVGAVCDPLLKAGGHGGCDRANGLVCNSMTTQCAAIAVATAGQPCGDVNDQNSPCGTNGVCMGASGTTPGTCTGAAADGTGCDTTAGPGCLDLSRCILGADGGTAGTCAMNGTTSCP